MPYADIQGLLNELATSYDDVDTDNFTLPTSRLKRYIHCTQLALYEIWNYHPWYFKMAFQDSLVFSSGQLAIPPNFANVGPNGLLCDSIGRKWTEVAFQAMVRLRSMASGANKAARVFCVGTLSPGPNSAFGDGGITTAMDRGLIIADNANTLPFTLFYETSPPKIQSLLLADPIPLPEDFHECLLYGAVAKLQENKNDPRDVWKSNFIAMLGKLVEIHYPLASRMLQMPMTVGGRMW